MSDDLVSRSLSSTALEEAAKAYRDVTFNALTLDECRDAATAAITAYLAQREKEGFVEVPSSAPCSPPPHRSRTMQVTDEMVQVAAKAAFYATPRNRKFEQLSAWKRSIALDEARAAITAALGAMWRPVESELPKMDEVVLVSYNSGFNGQPVIAFGARVDSGEGWLWGVKHGYGSSVHLDKDAGWNDVEADDDYQVTHWQPLTAPLLAPPMGK